MWQGLEAARHQVSGVAVDLDLEVPGLNLLQRHRGQPDPEGRIVGHLQGGPEVVGIEQWTADRLGCAEDLELELVLALTQDQKLGQAGFGQIDRLEADLAGEDGLAVAGHAQRLDAQQEEPAFVGGKRQRHGVLARFQRDLPGLQRHRLPVGLIRHVQRRPGPAQVDRAVASHVDQGYRVGGRAALNLGGRRSRNGRPCLGPDLGTEAVDAHRGVDHGDRHHGPFGGLIGPESQLDGINPAHGEDMRHFGIGRDLLVGRAVPEIERVDVRGITLDVAHTDGTGRPGAGRRHRQRRQRHRDHHRQGAQQFAGRAQADLDEKGTVLDVGVRSQR